MATKSTTAAVKKAVKKTVVKKAPAPKKTVSKKKSTAKVLVYSDNARSFWTSDGQIFNSLLALHDALKKMDKTVYGNHVSGNRHDFAQWVEVVLCDAECAADLRRAQTPTGARTAIAKHLKSYTL